MDLVDLKRQRETEKKRKEKKRLSETTPKNARIILT